MSCNAQISDADIVGAYSASYPYGNETLVLNKDGSYEQKISISGKSDVTNQGKWEFNSNEKLLIIQEPIIVDNGFGKPTDMQRKSGYWPLKVAGSGRQIKLNINEDQGFIFKKINY